MSVDADVSAALAAVRERVAAACQRAGRRLDGVRLVAVTKTVDAERIRALLASGHDLLGENRVQEALRKQEELGPGPSWHLIGQLQRNKARHAVGRFDLIHSVDGIRLAEELHRRAEAAGVRQAILVQVNVAGEATKAGTDEAGLPALLEAIEPLSGLELRGLMTIPPPVQRPAAAAVWFRRLRRLAEEAAGRLGRPLPELSMGMTNDFEVAVEEGATLIRVGRALFGERPPP